MQNDYFINMLKENNWIEIIKGEKYEKGSWFIIRDTSSWWIVGTKSNPRVFDVAEPTNYTVRWTINLIEHLCKTDDLLTKKESI